MTQEFRRNNIKHCSKVSNLVSACICCMLFTFIIYKDKSKPLGRIHFAAEGEISFKGILFVPDKPPSTTIDSQTGRKADLVKVHAIKINLQNFMPVVCFFFIIRIIKILLDIQSFLYLLVTQ